MKESLRNLGLEYVDLYLIHFPLKFNLDYLRIPVPKECVFRMDSKGVWEAMEECQNLGLAKSVGVEMNPLWQQKQLVEYCKENHILVTAYSPLGSVGSSWGNNSVISCVKHLKVPVPKECVTAIDIKSVWEAMEECQILGLIKSIGVSNFSTDKIQDILSFAKILPAVNQVEMNPLWHQKQLNKFCKENHILLTTYSPLASAGNSWGNNSVIRCDVLKDIAKSKGKTTAQVHPLPL
ncbi:D-galacturonate reductase-like protein [Tanacetum coccineum]